MSSINVLNPGQAKWAAITSFIDDRRIQTQESLDQSQANFRDFRKLPPELQLLTCRAAFSGPRLVHNNSTVIENLAAVGPESREFIRSKYSQIVNPNFRFPPESTFAYVNTETDTVLKDFLRPRLDDDVDIAHPLTDDLPVETAESFFELSDIHFEERCFRRFTGLSKIKHLALNIGELGSFYIHLHCTNLFEILQVCCPALETLAFCRADTPEHQDRSKCDELRLVSFYSNIMDYI